MKIDKDIAEGIIISSKDFEYAIAVKKNNSDTTIARQFIFKGKIGDFQKLLKGGNENQNGC